MNKLEESARNLLAVLEANSDYGDDGFHFNYDGEELPEVMQRLADELEKLS